MADLTSMLYDLARTAGKAASVSNDVKNIAKGEPEKVIKKAIRREAHKNLNKIMRGLF